MKTILSGGGLDSALTLFWMANNVKSENIPVQIIDYGQVAFKHEWYATNQMTRFVNEYFKREVFRTFSFNVELMNEEFEGLCKDFNLKLKPIDVSNSTLGGIGKPIENINPEIPDRNLSLSLYGAAMLTSYFGAALNQIEIYLSIPSGGHFEDSQPEYYERYNAKLPFQMKSLLFKYGNVRDNLSAAKSFAKENAKLDLLSALLDKCQPCWRPENEVGCGFCKKCRGHYDNMQFFTSLR